MKHWILALLITALTATHAAFAADPANNCGWIVVGMLSDRTPVAATFEVRALNQHYTVERNLKPDHDGVLAVDFPKDVAIRLIGLRYDEAHAESHDISTAPWRSIDHHREGLYYGTVITAQGDYEWPVFTEEVMASVEQAFDKTYPLLSTTVAIDGFTPKNESANTLLATADEEDC